MIAGAFFGCYRFVQEMQGCLRGENGLDLLCLRWSPARTFSCREESVRLRGGCMFLDHWRWR